MRLTRIEDMTIDTFPVTEMNRGQYEVCKEMLTNPGVYRLIFFSFAFLRGTSHEICHLELLDKEGFAQRRGQSFRQ